MTDELTEYAYFFFYSFVRTSYIKRLASKRPAGTAAPPLSTAAELILGASAGALAQIFTIPVAVIATRQQIGRSLEQPKGKAKAKAADPENGSTEAEKDVEYDDSFLGVAREIIAEEGVTGLWLGLKPGLVLTVNPAITYGMYERVKSILLLAKGETNNNAKLTPWMAFTVGALSKAIATVVCSLICTALGIECLACLCSRSRIHTSWRRSAFRRARQILRRQRQSTFHHQRTRSRIIRRATTLVRSPSSRACGSGMASVAGTRYICSDNASSPPY